MRCNIGICISFFNSISKKTPRCHLLGKLSPNFCWQVVKTVFISDKNIPIKQTRSFLITIVWIIISRLLPPKNFARNFRQIRNFVVTNHKHLSDSSSHSTVGQFFQSCNFPIVQHSQCDIRRVITQRIA